MLVVKRATQHPWSCTDWENCDQQPIVQTMSRLVRLARVAELRTVHNPPGKFVATTLREPLASPHYTNKRRDHEQG